MQTLIPSTPLLRASFLADAAASAVLGLALAAAAMPLAALLALPEPLLRGVGVVLLPWAGLMAWLGTRPHLPRWVVAAVLAVNVLWVADSAVLLAFGLVSPNALGVALVGGVASAVAVFALMQATALRRAAGARLAAA